MNTVIAGAVIATFSIDLLSKWFILNIVMVPPRVIEITSFFNLVLAHNTGISFGLFADFFAHRPLFLTVAKSAIVALLLVWAMRASNACEQLGVSIIAGGALGNIVDAAVNGGVTDFLDFHWGGWHFWTFNLADVAITIGVASVVVGILWHPPVRSRP